MLRMHWFAKVNRQSQSASVAEQARKYCDHRHSPTVRCLGVSQLCFRHMTLTSQTVLCTLSHTNSQFLTKTLNCLQS